MPEIRLAVPSWREAKFLLFWKAVDLKLTCRFGKHMPADYMQQSIVVLDRDNEVVFNEPAEVIRRCMRCDKLLVRSRDIAAGFNQAVWNQHIPKHYPIDPRMPHSNGWNPPDR